MRKISDQDLYEIRAEAFRIMTGMHAPGKDEPPSGPTHSYEDRCDAYTKWLSEYGSAIWAGVRAAATILCDEDDK